MNENKRAIILDTSSFHNKACDFAGISNSSITKLSSSIKRSGIDLLVHPVLRGEIIKHITLIWKEKISKAEKALCENNLIYSLAGLNTEEVSQGIQSADILERELAAFSEFFMGAINLPYPKPEVVFQKYFSNQAPFAETGKKKDEFPDAFVLESLIDYLKKNEDISIIAVSTDLDWEKALSDNSQIMLVKDIIEALRVINGSEEFACSVLETAEEQVKEAIRDEANSVYFTVPDYDVCDLTDFSSVEIESIYNIVVLDATDESIQLQFSASLILEGEFSFFDADESVWDSVDKEFVLTSYSMLKFKNAAAVIHCEIAFDISNPSSVKIVSFRILTDKVNEVELDEEHIEIQSLGYDVDVEGEQADALEEYYKH